MVQSSMTKSLVGKQNLLELFNISNCCLQWIWTDRFWLVWYVDWNGGGVRGGSKWEATETVDKRDDKDPNQVGGSGNAKKGIHLRNIVQVKLIELGD